MTTIEVPPLLPCPFCGDDEVTMGRDQHINWPQGVCNNCGARGPVIQYEMADAAAEWNKRAIEQYRARPQKGPFFMSSKNEQAIEDAIEKAYWQFVVAGYFAMPQPSIDPADRERAKQIISNIEQGFATGETLYFAEIAALLRKAYLYD